MRLDNYLLRVLAGVPRSYVYRIIRSGEVRINRGRAKPGNRLQVDDEIRIPPVRMRDKSKPERPPDDLIERVQSAIVVENNHWLMLNKPPGLPVHAGTGQRFGVIEVLRAARPDQTLELAHRLDRDTSGCLMIARSRNALNAVRQAMRAPGAQKLYLTLLAGAWRGGEREVDAPVVRDVERGGERMVEVDRNSPLAKHALSLFTPLELLTGGGVDASLAQVEIRTGRTHQIRVHAAHVGHPVAGDDKYGERRFNRQLRTYGLKRSFLHAWKLVLPGLDDGASASLQADVPEDLDSVLRRMRATQ